jgi:hypothetical protein
MKNKPIISRGESLRILENDLRKHALEQHGAELKSATEERRREIMDQIESEIREELRRRRIRFLHYPALLY